MLMSMRNEGTVTTSSVFIWGAGNYRIRLPALFCLSTGIGGSKCFEGPSDDSLDSNWSLAEIFPLGFVGYKLLPI